MKILKTILHSNYLYIYLFLLLSIYLIFSFNKKHTLKVDMSDNKFIGIITDYKIKDDLLTLQLKGKEKIIVYYYYKNIKEINYNLGDTIYVEGSFSLPKNNTIPNLFNYKKYLKSKKIYLTMNASSINKIENNKIIFYNIKNTFIKHISKYKSKTYLETFILGNKSMINQESINSYKENGISHLLAISGMHISLLGGFVLFFLKRIIKEEKAFLITSIFLLFYMLLTGLSASVIRSVLLFILLAINKLLKINISTIKVFILTLITILFINPNFIYDIGFIYSFTICLYLIVFSYKLKDKSYFKQLFLISTISFLVSIPITLYYSYEINFLSIVLNIFYVPFVSLIVFPFSILTFFVPILDNLFYIITNILERLSILTSNIKVFTFVMGKINTIFIIIYYAFITLFLYTNKKKYFLMIVLLLLIQYHKNYLFPKKYLVFIDVNQGDSILYHSHNKTLLLDTGGKINQKSNIVKKRIIPLLKSLGIKKIEYLVLSHGDYDHMGEAINLVNNFKVEKVIFNCGPFNDLEKELIKVLDKKNIKYYSCIKELRIDDNKLYFLQTKEYNNENDNSNVIYTELNGYKFMFMGDAGIDKEKDILDKYNISDIDVLKVGHHGSKTSSNKEFINKINPKYSIISVGKNNRYGHPSIEVLNNLEQSKIYRTDQDGSIMFNIKNNELRVKVCSS